MQRVYRCLSQHSLKETFDYRFEQKSNDFMSDNFNLVNVKQQLINLFTNYLLYGKVIYKLLLVFFFYSTTEIFSEY